MQRGCSNVEITFLRQGILLAAVLLLHANADQEQSPGFLIISAPRLAKISWVRLPKLDKYDGLAPTTLIETGLLHPQGLAVDQKRKLLLVADPDLQKVLAYKLVQKGDTLSVEGNPVTVVENQEARWVAVDGVGNVFYSDEPNNLILKVPADKVMLGSQTPEVIYDGNALIQINEPGGVAVDNYHVFWTNKHFGTEVGSLVKGSETPMAGKSEESVGVLASNVLKSYGVCLALNNVFYTDDEHRVYGTKKEGGEIVELDGSLQKPRGCAYDGDGTVYVADRGQNAVLAFPGNMVTLTQTKLIKAVDAEDAFGLAVAFSFGRRWSGSLNIISVLIATAFAMLS